jgi:phosphotriesterase-related protein
VKVLRTVNGDLPLDSMGITLSHEHVLVDGSQWMVDPITENDRQLSSKSPAMEDMWWLRQWPNTSRTNYLLDDFDLSVQELGFFAELGGSTVIDMTCSATMGREIEKLKKISKDTGINIVAGCGHYVEASHSRQVAMSDANELADVLINEIRIGVDGTEIRAGVIGEIGVSHPITVNETKCLHAAAIAQKETGASITVHTACDALGARSAIDAASCLLEFEADLSRVVMGHVDTFAHDIEYLVSIIEMGCSVAFDLFGNETFHSEYGFAIPGDSEKIRSVVALCDRGLAEHIFLGHDTAMKIQLRKYGGYGYGHIIRNIVPRFRLSGLDEKHINQMLIENPKRMFCVDSISA